MHDDLLAIIALWEADQALAKAQEAIRAREVAITEATAREAEIAAGRAEIAAKKKALGIEEQTLQRRLDDATTRKERTQALIDGGKATDFLTATRQVETAKEQISTLETAILTLMEEGETLAARDGELARSAVLWAARHREAIADRERDLPAQQEELARCQALREQRWAAVSRNEQSHYKVLRSRGFRPIARFPGGVCEACHMGVPPQMGSEVRRGARAHHCRGCGRWLVEEAE